MDIVNKLSGLPLTVKWKQALSALFRPKSVLDILLGKSGALGIEHTPQPSTIRAHQAGGHHHTQPRVILCFSALYRETFTIHSKNLARRWQPLILWSVYFSHSLDFIWKPRPPKNFVNYAVFGVNLSDSREKKATTFSYVSNKGVCVCDPQPP